MRGVHSAVDDIRRNVFTEVARLAYEGGDLSRVDMIPYKMISGEVAHHRHDVFLERAIVQERVRLALGMNLQTAQDTDNGYSVFEQSLLRYIAAGLGVSYEQLSRNYAQMSYSTARASANESWAYFMGRRKFVASRQASQMFLCWLEEAIVRRVVTLPSKARFSFQEARSAWGNCDWIGSGRMAIDGLKEVQEAVMLIEAGLSTYEKECAKRGDDYQEIFAQQVRETMERRAAGLKPPAWAAAAFESGLRQSTEEEKSDSRAA